MCEFFVRPIDGKNLDGDKQNYYCSLCGEILDKKNSVEVIAHRDNAVDEKTYLCHTCYKHHMPIYCRRRTVEW